MTARKPLVQIDGQLSELPNTDVAPNNVVTTTNAPTDNAISWVENVEGAGEGFLSLLSVSGIGTVYNKQVTLFAKDASGNKYFAHLQRV